MKQKLFTICIAFLCIFSMHTAAVYATEDVIPNDETGVPDKALYHAILSELDKKDGETFTRREAAAIDWVGAGYGGGQPVRSLKGIGCLVNLQQLALDGNAIRTLDGIEELKYLKYLDLSFSRVKDWKPLAELEALSSLYIDGCKLSDFKKIGIKKFKNLKTLSARECGLKKVDELKRLKNLEVLYLSENRITDAKALGGLTKLKTLHLHGNRLKKLPSLKKLSRLKELSLNFNYLSGQEITAKVPKRILKDKRWKSWTLLSQKYHAVIKLKEPSSAKGIPKNTKTISGSLSLIPGYQNGYRVRLCNPAATYCGKLWNVDADGSFVLNGLDLKKWAGDTITLEALVNPKLEGMDSWYVINTITFQVKK